MSKLDNVRRIVKEDYESKYHQLIDRLAYTLNPTLEQMVDLVNGKLGFDNIAQETIKVDVIVNGSRVPQKDNLFRTKFANPSGIMVIKAENLDSGKTHPTAAPWVSWTSNGQLITIKEVAGIQASTNYRLTLLVIS